MSIFNKFKPISISLSPNVEYDDVILALKLIFMPWKWKSGLAVNKEFEDRFKNYLGVKYAFSFNSGRSSLFAILKSLDLRKKDEVLLQAFTCNAVPNPILWAGLNPIYVDCNKDNFNIDIHDLKKKINSKTKALIVQHTFGLPSNIEEIIFIVRQNNLILIEDCAHALGAEYNSKKVGTFGDVAFFSFSRDKVISSVYGGIAVTDNPLLAEKIKEAQSRFSMPSMFWVFQQILHPVILYFFILPIYYFLDLGKIFLFFSQWTHILSKAVSYREKRGLKPNYFPHAMPNALAMMAQNQFLKLEKFNNHRKKIAEFYFKELENTKFILPKNEGIFLRFPVKHSDAHKIIYEAWYKENILIGDWYTSPIAPDDTKIEEMKYKTGMCPNAEELSKITLNLPTHINISMEDARRIVNFLSKWT